MKPFTAISTACFLGSMFTSAIGLAEGATTTGPTNDNELGANSPEQSRSMDDTREIGLLFGLLQPVLASGANVQLEATLGRFVFDYSHGMSLDIATVGDAKDQNLTLHLPYSTGLGIGYRLTEEFDLRFEPKLHQYQIEYDSGPAEGEVVTRYKTVTLGIGAYYRWRPFKSGAAKGITIAPSIRFWPNVYSSLDDNKVVYNNVTTGRQETHQAQNIGFANTPMILNISLGYVFSL